MWLVLVLLRIFKKMTFFNIKIYQKFSEKTLKKIFEGRRNWVYGYNFSDYCPYIGKN